MQSIWEEAFGYMQFLMNSNRKELQIFLWTVLRFVQAFSYSHVSEWNMGGADCGSVVERPHSMFGCFIVEEALKAEDMQLTGLTGSSIPTGDCTLQSCIWAAAELLLNLLQEEEKKATCTKPARQWHRSEILQHLQLGQKNGVKWGKRNPWPSLTPHLTDVLI